MWKAYAAVNGAYDFDYALSRYCFDPLVKADQKERWIDLPVRIGDEQHIVRIQALGNTRNPAFLIQSDSLEQKQELIQYTYRLFQWDKDLTKIYDHFQQTSLSPLFARNPGTPVVREGHLYDSLIKTIIHQQLNMKFAYTLSSRFVQAFGEKRDGVWFYPDPKRVAELKYDDLRKLQFSQRKAEYVIDTSRLIAENAIDLENLAARSDEQVIQELTNIRGIGVWTAENWLLFGVGRDDLLPAADIGIQNALKQLLNQDQKPPKEKIYEMGKQWSPYRSYASLVLWRSIEKN
ncbi:DNA-3-methyladenine glycosylase II [Melghiribacillus thermohalophilus]|uniref:DNA-3-methyladenine glycosylase II n=1 Tax=Melghiribacillus thermohalophilus TaxID=1324956 RepID=A0A4R3MU65_9BACI|nr:DNA-3-methyladenine glycosylase [Melghiribacillus thermohalophilus]TCT19635.1 DNA-3-methyladenine glycosylase II [Melghiribacillus thermohalophilus]